MSLDNFIPSVWSGRLLSNLDTALVYAQGGVVNRDYEGEIQGAGSSVKINSMGRITVSDYTKNTDHATPETLTDAQRTLTITEQKMFNFQIDDIDAAQQKPKVMNEAMSEAAYALAKATDTFVAGKYVDVDSGNLVGSDGSPITGFIATPKNFYDLVLIPLKVVLDKADVPDQGRWVVIPPFAESALLRDDRFVSFGTQQNRENLANGQIGSAAGFRILQSNNVPAPSSKYKILAGHPMAISYAEQIESVEGFRPERRFGDAVKGLHVYGAKVVRPTCLALGTATDS